MTVYIEYVLLDNFVIDYLLIKATAYTVNNTASTLRSILGAIFGGIFALTVPLCNLVGFLYFLIKLSGGVIIVFIVFKFKSFKETFTTVIAFISLSFLVGGAISGLYSLTGVNISGDFSIALTILPVYLCVVLIKRTVKYFGRRVKLYGLCYKTEIVSDGKTHVYTGFLDTGNTLSIENQPVVFVQKKVFLSLIDLRSRQDLTEINFNTVNGAGRKKAIKNQTLKIYFSDKPNIYNNVIIAVSDGISGGYDIILNSIMLGETDNEQTYKSNIKGAI